MNRSFLETLKNEKLGPRRLLHVGANMGQEAAFYEEHGIEAWHIEAIPDVYKTLERNCASHHGQHSVQALLSDINGKETSFSIANNKGLSSSLLELGRHAAAYPGINYTKTIELKSTTIDQLIADGIIPPDIDFLLIDVQGAELLVLNGATSLLESSTLEACQIETAVTPLYQDGATYLEIAQKLALYDLHLRQCVFNRRGWTDALFMRPYWPQLIPAEGPWSLEKIHIMVPKQSPRPLIRVGGNRDGAYLLPDDLNGVVACFSPGVLNRKHFEDELLARFGIACHLCDYSSDESKFKTPLMEGQTFKKKWLGLTDNDTTISLEEWISELSPNPEEDLILQMDIEGAEYRILLNTPDAILRRFRTIVIELHALSACRRPNTFKKELGPVLTLLDQHFICVHAHPNNCCGDFIVPGADLNIPNVIELTLLRRDRFTNNPIDYHPPLLPHPLDISCNVPKYPPLFLNEHWLMGHRRTPESTIKMQADQIRYLTSELKKTQLPAEQPKRQNCD